MTKPFRFMCSLFAIHKTIAAWDTVRNWVIQSGASMCVVCVRVCVYVCVCRRGGEVWDKGLADSPTLSQPTRSFHCQLLKSNQFKKPSTLYNISCIPFETLDTGVFLNRISETY